MTNEQQHNQSNDYSLSEAYIKWRYKAQIKQARDQSSKILKDLMCSIPEKIPNKRKKIMESKAFEKIIASNTINALIEDRYIKQIINRKDPNLQYLIPNNSFESYFLLSNKILLLLECLFFDK